MSSQLEEIVAVTRRGVLERSRTMARKDLEAMAARHRPRGFARSLTARASDGAAVIAEIKKASPSKGTIRADFDVGALASGLARGGAAALSVLTEEQFFQGSLQNLEIASEASRLPCLRKDFIVDPFQILEARAHRADAILLIAAVLSDAEMRNLTRAAKRLELDVLCEVHTGDELRRVLGLDLDCEALGVNNRNLHSFEVTLKTSLELAPLLPSNAVRVAESGIHTPKDIRRLRAAGFDAFLIGESLMRQPHPGGALERLIAAVQSPALHSAAAGS